MVTSREIGRIGMLAGALGVGAALAQAPVASADGTTDSTQWLSAVDLLPAASSVPSEANFAISFDGMNLIEAGSATATTENGDYGLAIAIGDHATAISQGGDFDNALAVGSYAFAAAGSTASGATGSDFNTAIDIGNNSSAFFLQPNGAYAGGGSLIGNIDSGSNSHNTAIDIGNNGLGLNSATPNGYSGALAGDGQLVGHSGVGNGNTAIAVGDTHGLYDHPAAVAGDDNYASVFGNLTGNSEGAFAAFGNNNSAMANASYTEDGQGVFAGAGNGNLGYVLGPDNSVASAGGITTQLGWPTDSFGDHNIAAVFDPFTTTDPASHVVAGTSDGVVGSDDLAEVLFTHGVANIGAADSLYEIVTAFGTFESNVLAHSAEALLSWFGLL